MTKPEEAIELAKAIYFARCDEVSRLANRHS